MTKVDPTHDVIRLDTNALTVSGTIALAGVHVTIDGNKTELVAGSTTLFDAGAGTNAIIESVTTGNGSAASLTMEGGSVTLHDSTIVTSPNTAAIHVTGGSLSIDEGQFAGLRTYAAIACEAGGTISVTNSTFTDVDLSATGCDVTLERNKFTHTGDGGFQVANGKFRIENNLISNGGQYPDVASVLNGASGSVLRFNTFVDYYTAADRSGETLHCDGTVDVSSNIFASGRQAVSGCTPKYSLFDDASALPATGNNVLSALTAIFVSSTDFHLSATSTARDHGEPNTGVTTDLDGNVRGSTPDIGAYEAQ